MGSTQKLTSVFAELVAKGGGGRANCSMKIDHLAAPAGVLKPPFKDLKIVGRKIWLRMSSECALSALSTSAKWQRSDKPCSS